MTGKFHTTHIKAIRHNEVNRRYVVGDPLTTDKGKKVWVRSINDDFDLKQSQGRFNIMVESDEGIYKIASVPARYWDAAYYGPDES